MIERLNSAANMLCFDTLARVKLSAWRYYGGYLPDEMFEKFVTVRRYWKTDVYFFMGEAFVAVKDARRIQADNGVIVFVEVIDICRSKS